MKKYKVLREDGGYGLYKNNIHDEEDARYYDIPALIKDGYLEEIIEPKEEIIEGFRRKHSVGDGNILEVFSSPKEFDECTPAILIKDPTPQTLAMLKGERYERFVSDEFIEMLGKNINMESNKYYSHKITIII